MPPPFRADHIGSLIRPQYLLDAVNAVEEGMHMHNLDYSGKDADVVKRAKDAEKKAISEVVEEQAKRGITPITSGEFDRPSFVSGFFESLGGIEIQFKKVDQFKTGHPIMRPYVELGIPGRDQPVATGKIKFKQSAYKHEWEMVRDALPEQLWKDVKITIPSPSWSVTQLKDGESFTESAYSNESEYLKDMGEATRREILALYDAGVRFVQIDDPMFAMLVDEEYLAEQKAEGKDLDALISPSIVAHNLVTRDLPSDMTVAFHLCRGNIPKEMNYKRFALEWDDDIITGDFTPLKSLPPGKVAVLGLVTTKDSELENISKLKSKVFDAADIIAKAQGVTREEALKSLAVSPGCGFSSVAPVVGTGMNEQIQWQKLELVKKLAEEVWGSS